MAYVFQDRALRILASLHEAEDDLVGSAVQTMNAEAGTVHAIKLDEHHGLCFTFDKPFTGFALQYEGPSQRWYPVSTIRLKG